MRYTVDEKRIAHQTVDGEVIAIDFASGRYFSMRGSAAEIWQMLALGYRAEDAILGYQKAHPAQSARIETEVRQFVESLAAATLIVPAELAAPSPAAPPPAAQGEGSYATPVLEKFEDMAELIKLDPVHDVSEQGWPHAAAPRPPGQNLPP